MLIRMMYISLASGVHDGRKTTAKICAWKSTWCNPFRDVIEGSWPDAKCIWRPGKKPSYTSGTSLSPISKGSWTAQKVDRCRAPRNLLPNYLEGALVCPPHFEDGDFDRDIRAELMDLQRSKRLKRGAMLIVPGSLLFSGEIRCSFVGTCIIIVHLLS